MIITEIITHNGREFKRTYTDSDKTMLHKIGTDEYYGEAIDAINSNFTYEEVPIPDDAALQSNVEHPEEDEKTEN